MIKTYKVMLLPNNKQSTMMFKTAGAARFVYNWTIATENTNHELGNKFIDDIELRRIFTNVKKQPEFSWLNNYSNDALKQSIKDACNAYKKFFKGLCKYPKFKSKRKSTPSFYMDTHKISISGTHVKLEKLVDSRKSNRQKLNYVRLAEHNRLPENAKYYNPRVKFDGLHWWLTIGVEYDTDHTILDNNGVGIDLGVKDLAICSDGYKYKNINKTRKVKNVNKKKRRLQRKISRKYIKNKKERKYCKTCNIIKSEQQLLKVSRKLTNIHKNYLHQVTTEIVNRKPRFIVLEDLNVKGMMKNKHLAKSTQEQGFYEFRTLIEYKSKQRNISLIIADRWFPSSKTCSCCKTINKNLQLKDRIFICPNCGFTIDRDYQAAINLAKYGEQISISA